ncbi:hypothetical protein ACI8AK_05065 [Geodermatophilus sp. SYSU D00867]
MLRSAWIKWARAVEHQKAFAREMREFDLDSAFEYVQFDNTGAREDPLVRIDWRLRVKKEYPERWSILLGDVLGDFRAALDHAMYDAVVAHAGPPTRPEDVYFPIHTDVHKFGKARRKLASLVAPPVWEMIDAVQPFYGGDRAHTSPLQILRWLSNRDKHRQVHVIGRTAVDMGPFVIRSEAPLEVVHEWRREGEIGHGSVVGRLKVRRPVDPQYFDVMPTFAFEASIQISDEPVEYRPLASAMDVIREKTLGIMAGFAQLLETPFPEGLELGEQHDAYAVDRGGHAAFFTGLDGERRRLAWPTPDAKS